MKTYFVFLVDSGQEGPTGGLEKSRRKFLAICLYCDEC